MSESSSIHKVQDPSRTYSSSFTYYPSSILTLLRNGVSTLRFPITGTAVNACDLRDLQKSPSNAESPGLFRLETTDVGKRIVVQGDMLHTNFKCHILTPFRIPLAQRRTS